LLAENADKDPILRHGAVLGLAGAASVEQLAEKKNDGRVPVRIGAVLALRRQVSPLVAEFLKDPEEAVVLEAARAIHDQPITAAFPALADLVKGDACKNLRVLERAVNANYRLGQPRHAQALAQFSTNAAIPEAARRDALEALADWAKPSPKDRVLNQWRPIASRDAQHAAGAVMPVLGVLLADHGGAVQETAAHLARRLSLKGAGQSLATVAKDETARAGARIAALRALAAFKDERLLDAARCAMSAKDDKLRSEGLKALAAFDPASAAKAIAEVIERGSLREKQGGIVALTQIDRPEARTIISELMDKLMAGQCPPEIQLDVYEAAKKVGMTDRAQQFKAALPQNDPLANYKLSLAGGDADRGRKIFREKVEVQCLRCHKCEIGDSLVGPDLTKIASEKDRLYLLESIIFPNAHIAQGFQIVTLTMKDNQMIAGRLLNEGAGQLTIETMDEQGKPKAAIVAADQIKERLSAPSPMPENIRDQLSRWELRDLVEYLATRK
jgi:quinoprotein glucose dehydrogenase